MGLQFGLAELMTAVEPLSYVALSSNRSDRPSLRRREHPSGWFPCLLGYGARS
jgi:hypothetical protein